MAAQRLLTENDNNVMCQLEIAGFVQTTGSLEKVEKKKTRKSQTKMLHLKQEMALHDRAVLI